MRIYCEQWNTFSKSFTTNEKTPKYLEWTQEMTSKKVYANQKIFHGSGYALLTEPRSLLEPVYKYIEENYNQYEYVFTHDEQLLKTLPNAKLLIFGGCWYYNGNYEVKNKNISMLASNKQLCTLHSTRYNLAMKYDNDDRVDCYGTFKYHWVHVSETLDNYRYSIILENEKSDYWFTEKIVNCFRSKTVPIYYGANKIGDFFNIDGIVIIDDLEKIDEILEKCTVEDYESKREAIEENYRIAEDYELFEDIFYRMYKDLLEN